MPKIVGKVSWFNNAKGYGFLSQESGPDIFVHYSNIESDGYRTLKEGDPVSFDIGAAADGRPQAVNVVKAVGGP